MSGEYGVGVYDGDAYASWSRRMFDGLRVGGIWAVPRSGLVFTRTGEKTLALTEVMPHDPAMPLTPRKLHEQQASDYQGIQFYMKQAGVTVYDMTDTFD